MVANVSIQVGNESLIYGDFNSFMQLRNGNFFLSQLYFKTLNDMNDFQINEFRFYCYKPSHGRTIHIASTSSVDSKEWVQYLVGNIDGMSCGENCVSVIRTLAADNSLLAKGVLSYGKSYDSNQRVYDHTVWEPFRYHIIMIALPHKRRFNCDDTTSTAGVWQVYIR